MAMIYPLLVKIKWKLKKALFTRKKKEKGKR